MNKMAKGAIATGVGVLLLVGGGGTLATWNQAQNATMGSVVSGDLNLVTVDNQGDAGKGHWNKADGTAITNIAAYLVVPGDVLTYTQNVKLTLTGDRMKANLSVTGIDTGLNSSSTSVATTLSEVIGTGAPTTISASTALTPADNNAVVTAVTTFTFKDVTDRTSVNTTYDLTHIGYALVQQAPTA